VIKDEASHSEAMEALAEAESERDRDEVLLGCAFDADAKDGDAIAKLARDETSDRSFGTSRSFAKFRRSVDHPRFRVLLRWTQTIPNDNLPTTGDVLVDVPASSASASSRPEFRFLRNRANLPGDVFDGASSGR